MIAVDPYDTGKFGWLGIDGVDDRNTRTATASRARDPQFDSAVIGNSTAQMLNPAELSRATGLRFVQLYLTGGSPREQLAVLNFFLRNHQRVARWCSLPILSGALMNSGSHGPAIFPIGSTTTARSPTRPGLMSWPAIEHVSQRISIGLGLRKRNDPDGFFSYEDIWLPGTFRQINPPRDPVPAGSAARPRQLPRSLAARRRDQAASGQCGRRSGRAADLSYYDRQARHG